jgi:uncharacterized OsmC-like protein
MPIRVLAAQSRATGPGIRSEITIRQHHLVADEPPELLGADTGPMPLELLLASLGACLTTLAALVAPRLGVELRSITAAVEGDIDFAGARGAPDVRAGFQAIRVRLEVDSPSSDDRVSALVHRVEAACAVRDSLAGVPVQVDSLIRHTEALVG